LLAVVTIAGGRLFILFLLKFRTHFSMPSFSDIPLLNSPRIRSNSNSHLQEGSHLMMRWLLFLLMATTGIAAAAAPSSSLLDVSPDGKKLLVANTDNGTITVVDLTTQKALNEIPVGDHPEGVAWVGNGPLAIATVYRDDKIVFLDTATGKVESIKGEAEPYGVVVSPDGQKAYVTHDYPGTVSVVDIASRKIERTIPVGQWARGIALAADGSKLYVSHFFSADLSAIDLKQNKVVDRWPGRESDNLSRHVLLHPSRPKAYLSHIRSRVHIFNARGSIFPELSICTLTPAEGDKKRRVAISLDTFNGVYVTANPWESALSPDNRRLFTIYAGTDDMNYSEVIDDDYQELDRTGVVPVGKHPRALRFSPDGKKLYVYATMDFSVQVFDVTKTRPYKEATIKVCNPPHTPEWVRGKVLFQMAQPPMTRVKWVSCSGCHPDGAQDGRTWENPEGLRKTPPLFSLAHTHPLHWSADRDEVQDFEYTIRGKLMSGGGLCTGPIKPRPGFLPASELEEKLSGRSKDLDALAIYTNSFQPKLSPHIPAPGKLSPEAVRGKALFFDKEVGCATCHSGPYYSDSTLKKPFVVHDVGTGGGEDEKMGPAYDTPTLLGVYRMNAYLHHGKAKSLMEVLTEFNPKDQHGKTSHLSKAQKEDLIAFIKALPYETPPDNTPNTVPHRTLLKFPQEASSK
jgi:YVTN family beta-propeller protein